MAGGLWASDRATLAPYKYSTRDSNRPAGRTQDIFPSWQNHSPHQRSREEGVGQTQSNNCWLTSQIHQPSTISSISSILSSHYHPQTLQDQGRRRLTDPRTSNGSPRRGTRSSSSRPSSLSGPPATDSPARTLSLPSYSFRIPSTLMQ